MSEVHQEKSTRRHAALCAAQSTRAAPLDDLAACSPTGSRATLTLLKFFIISGQLISLDDIDQSFWSRSERRLVRCRPHSR